jgi:hypothetical protein
MARPIDAILASLTDDPTGAAVIVIVENPRIARANASMTILAEVARSAAFSAVCVVPQRLAVITLAHPIDANFAIPTDVSTAAAVEIVIEFSR